MDIGSPNLRPTQFVDEHTRPDTVTGQRYTGEGHAMEVNTLHKNSFSHAAAGDAHQESTMLKYVESPEFQEPIFKQHYVFGVENGSELTLTDAIQIIDHVAETLGHEILFSGANGMKDANSQFDAAVQQTEIDNQSWSLVSAGLSEMTYRPDLVAEYLADSLTITAVKDRMSNGHPAVQAATREGREAARALIAEERLSSEALTASFKRLTDQAPKLTHQGWKQAGKDQAPNEARQYRERVLAWREGTLRDGCDAIASERLRAWLGGAAAPSAEGILMQRATEIAADAQGYGLARLWGFARELQDQFTADLHVIRVRLDGAEGANRTPQQAGAQVQLQQMERTFPAELQKLQRRTIFGDTKAEFVTSWAERYTRVSSTTVTAQVTISALEKLLANARLLCEAMTVLFGRVQTQVGRMQETAANRLMRRSAGNVVEQRILAVAAIVDIAFKKDLDQARDANLADLVRSLISDPSGLMQALQTLISDPGATIRIESDFAACWKTANERAARLFIERCGELTILDAIAEEFKARLSSNDPAFQDPALVEATKAGNSRGMLDRYLERRFEKALNQSAPFWQIDQVAKARYPKPGGEAFPYTMNVITIDKEMYGEFRERHGISDILGGIEATQQGHSTHRRDPHRITFYVRSGGVALAHLDGQLVRTMIDAFQAIRHTRPLFTDDRLDPVITEFLPPAKEERAASAIALALATGIARFHDPMVRFLDFRGYERALPLPLSSPISELDRDTVEDLLALVEADTIGLGSRDRHALRVRAAQIAREHELADQGNLRLWWQGVVKSLEVNIRGR